MTVKRLVIVLVTFGIAGCASVTLGTPRLTVRKKFSTKPDVAGV